MSENYMEKMKELGISEEVVNQVLAVAKRMDDKGLVNCREYFCKSGRQNLYYANRTK